MFYEWTGDERLELKPEIMALKCFIWASGMDKRGGWTAIPWSAQKMYLTLQNKAFYFNLYRSRETSLRELFHDLMSLKHVKSITYNSKVWYQFKVVRQAPGNTCDEII